jgi:hypothetical protein
MTKVHPAFLDTCLLLKPYLCDTLLSIAEAAVYRPLWSADVIAELCSSPHTASWPSTRTRSCSTNSTCRRSRSSGRFASRSPGTGDTRVLCRICWRYWAAKAAVARGSRKRASPCSDRPRRSGCGRSPLSITCEQTRSAGLPGQPTALTCDCMVGVELGWLAKARQGGPVVLARRHGRRSFERTSPSDVPGGLACRRTAHLTRSVRASVLRAISFTNSFGSVSPSRRSSGRRTAASSGLPSTACTARYRTREK